MEKGRWQQRPEACGSFHQGWVLWPPASLLRWSGWWGVRAHRLHRDPPVALLVMGTGLLEGPWQSVSLVAEAP